MLDLDSLNLIAQAADPTLYGQKAGKAIALGVGAGGGAAGAGSAAGCAGGGVSCSGPEGVCGASTPDELPGGNRFWLGPIEPGGRGMASKPGGVPCAKACEPVMSAHAATSAAMKGRPHGAGMVRMPVIAPRLPLEIGRIQAAHRGLS